MEEIKEINEILFSVASSSDIRSKSVYVANVSKYTDNKKNTVYDHRGGSIFGKKCETCKNYEQNCPGHFGVIELNTSIVHPILFNHVFNLLKIICYNCSKLLLAREHLEFSDILKFDGERRLMEIINKVKKFTKCFHCDSPKREYKIKKDPSANIIQYDNDSEISDLEIKNIFNDIDMETLDLLAISHPKNCILDVFPVIPPCCRPYEFVGNVIKEDDLTKQLVEIIKCNSLIPTATYKKTIINNLKIKIETFCRSPKKKTRVINNDPVKGIRERLTGKDGQLRDNLMGKRTEMSARTVIGPGPNLKLDEVGVPEIIAKNITFPINVYQSNFDEILQLIENGCVTKIKRNDKIIRLDIQKYSAIIEFLKQEDIVIRNGKEIRILNTKFDFVEGDRIIRDGVDITPEKLPEISPPDLRIGDIAQRNIIEGDWVLMNRQPTLWKGSMMGFKVVITKNKTFTFNLAVCKAFNSDFDGDEQNAHFPQSIESSVELQLLSTPEECICSSTNGVPVIVILQDGLLGAYLMSQENAMIVSKHDYNDIIMALSRSVEFFLRRKDQIRDTLKKLDLYKGEHSLRTGRSILSLILPHDFNLKTDDLEIKEGVLIKGILNKNYLGSSKSSLIYIIKREYSNKDCVDFINDIQFMTNKWLLHNSFSVNIADCYQNDNVENIIEEKLSEADFISNTILNKRLSEAKVNLVLSNAKDVGMKLAEDVDNNFVHTIKSGSKGDYFNLGQVKGLLGQQIINSKRIDLLLDNGTRSLIHYRKNVKDLTQRERYESRGFVMNSFYKGMNPKEFFFHSMSGRQGVCDTAMTTFMSGYNMRKLVKLTEDIKINNDGIVSDSYNNIYSYAYGDTGLNPECNDVDVSRIIDRLNLE